MKDILTVQLDKTKGFSIYIEGIGLIKTFSLEQEKDMCWWVVCYASNSDMMIDFRGW
jgi:hypothetical protein